jgi:hypothetical protein
LHVSSQFFGGYFLYQTGYGIVFHFLQAAAIFYCGFTGEAGSANSASAGDWKLNNHRRFFIACFTNGWLCALVSNSFKNEANFAFPAIVFLYFYRQLLKTKHQRTSKTLKNCSGCTIS